MQATTAITTSSGSMIAASLPSKVIRVVASRKPALGQFIVSGGPGITQTYQVLVPVINADTVLGQPVGTFLEQSIVSDPAQNAYPLRFTAPVGSIGTTITYTAQFTPTQLGIYSLAIRLRGLTNAGLPFSETGRRDTEILAPPQPLPPSNPLVEVLQWLAPLSLLLFSLAGAFFLWSNRRLLPRVVAVRRQTKREVNRIMAAEKAKRDADAKTAAEQTQLQVDAAVATERVNWQAAHSALETAIAKIQGELEAKHRKLEEAEAALSALETKLTTMAQKAVDGEITLDKLALT